MKIMSYLKLVRMQNLGIILLTMYMMRYLVVKPLLVINGFDLQFDNFHFLLLVFSTMFITAAGYVINDYFDRKTDMVNHPEDVIIGRQVNRRKAMILHLVFNILGVAVGIYLAIHVGILLLALVFPIIAGLLWFYSTTYKRQFLIGNILVAFLTALVPLMIPLFEIPLLNKYYQEILVNLNMNFSFLIKAVGVFALFAFLSTLIREIIKDVEDFEGDAAYGRNTLPVTLGVINTKWIIIGLSAFFVFILLFAYIKLKSLPVTGLFEQVTMLYFVMGLIIPLAFLCFKVYNANSTKDYHTSSMLMKVIMLVGVSYSIIIKYFLF